MTTTESRYTFLIDPQSKVTKVYLTANISRHSREVVDDLMKLTKQLSPDNLVGASSQLNTAIEQRKK